MTNNASGGPLCELPKTFSMKLTNPLPTPGTEVADSSATITIYENINDC